MCEKAPRNVVSVTGRIISDLEFSHEIRKERFYLTYLSVERKSGKADILPVLFSDQLLDMSRDYKDTFVEVEGQFRSYRRNDYYRNMLTLMIFAYGINVFEDAEGIAGSNDIYLSGLTCAPTVFRKTPLGRNITDLYLLVKRAHGRHYDHIPCVAWGQNAKLLADLACSSRINIWGRIESREYTKYITNTERVKRTAYEVCINKFELLPDECAGDEAEHEECAVDNSDVTC